MATKRITEVVTVTAQEVVGALQQLGYPISGTEKVEARWRKPLVSEGFDGLTFTSSYEDALRRLDQGARAAPEKPADAKAGDVVVEEPAPTGSSGLDIPF